MQIIHLFFVFLFYIYFYNTFFPVNFELGQCFLKRGNVCFKEERIETWVSWLTVHGATHHLLKQLFNRSRHSSRPVRT